MQNVADVRFSPRSQGEYPAAPRWMSYKAGVCDSYRHTRAGANAVDRQLGVAYGTTKQDEYTVKNEGTA